MTRFRRPISGRRRKRMLELDAIESFYGESQIQFGLLHNILEGEVVSRLSRNDIGKTTTVRGITGLTPARRGVIRFKGENITALPSYRIARRGIALVHEGRLISPNLTVKENLVATRSDGPSG